MESSGFIHIPSGVIFMNRKQAIMVMGQNRYNRSLKNAEFQWLTAEKEENK